MAPPTPKLAPPARMAAPRAASAAVGPDTYTAELPAPPAWIPTRGPPIPTAGAAPAACMCDVDMTRACGRDERGDPALSMAALNEKRAAAPKPPAACMSVL